MAPHLETGANAAAMRRRRAGRGGIVIAIAAVLLLSACGPPITVRRVPAREVTADLARSALNSNRPSLFSENALYRWGLTALYRSHPEAALAALRERLDDRAPNSTSLPSPSCASSTRSGRSSARTTSPPSSTPTRSSSPTTRPTGRRSSIRGRASPPTSTTAASPRPSRRRTAPPWSCGRASIRSPSASS
ncbi:MAG: hypothetical protein U0802_01295 [Candidatus Binatia bacterium]